MKHERLLKRLATLAAAVLLAVLTAGCAEPVFEPSRAAEPEEPAQTAAPTETPAPTEAPAPPVVDAYRDAFTWKDKVECSYAIPKLNLESADARSWNADVYERYYTELLEGTQYPFLEEEVGYPIYTEISYDWAVNGDVLSVWIRARGDEGMDVLEPANFSVSTGEALTPAEVLGAAGETDAGFRERAREALCSAFWDRCGAALYTAPETAGPRESYAAALADTLSEENIDYAAPVLNGDGHLCAVGTVYFAEGGMTAVDVMIDLETYERSPYYAETVDGVY